MQPIVFLQPRRLTFGAGCIRDAAAYIAHGPWKRVHIVASPSAIEAAESIRMEIAVTGHAVTSLQRLPTGEPTVDAFERMLVEAKSFDPDCIIGIGGGSALDVSKLIAAFVQGIQSVSETFGIGMLAARDCYLICLPTTAGTGSEVSPNAILLDDRARLKKAVISEHLVPDAAFIDPALSCSLPAGVTAATGVDALTHCIEAYTNRHAHPMVDLYALEGVRLIASSLVQAVRNGDDLAAREDMARASLYGGLCLGPVNTAAVHALAYPLGSEFHVPHGLSNAVLLPAVFRFNATASPERHAAVAQALGVPPLGPAIAMAQAGADALSNLVSACGLVTDLASFGVGRAAIPAMAQAAMTVQRLLKNNPRELTVADAEAIYAEALAATNA